MKLNEIKNENQHYFKDELGRKQGEYKSWWDNGQQWVICHFRDDKRHGEFKSWHENGLQWVICHYKGGNMHGERKSWYSTGQQWSICHYKDGKLHGELRRWDSFGKLDVHAFDIDGEVIVNFLENPELYPSTPEEKTMFVLRYDSGKFIGDLT